MHLVHELINYLTNLPPSTWTTLASYLGGSTVVASILQIVKHKLNFAEARNLIVLALGFFSFLAAFADFLIQANPALSALPWLGHVTGLVMAGAVVIHRLAVSPVYYRLAAKLQTFNKLLKEVEVEQLVPAQVPDFVVKDVPILPDEANLIQFKV